MERLSYASRNDPVRVYLAQAQRLTQRYGAQTDYSHLDWMIACDMAQSGRFTQRDIECCIREGSPNIESRKAGPMEDYARRTAARAWEAPEVKTNRPVQQEREMTQDRPRDGGYSMLSDRQAGAGEVNSAPCCIFSSMA